MNVTIAVKNHHIESRTFIEMIGWYNRVFEFLVEKNVVSSIREARKLITENSEYFNWYYDVEKSEVEVVEDWIFDNRRY